MFALKSVLVLAAVVVAVSGHGRMVNPPSRASMWRYGFSNPPDYADNQGFCGGTQTQWVVNGGKCGICGDPYQGPRTHEPGPDNVFANGVIVKQYEAGQEIDVSIQITAYHKGYFEFRICPSSDDLGTVTQECLDENLLELADGGTRYKLPGSKPFYDIKLRLPPGRQCEQCVIQWIYHTGNSWGCDSPGVCGSGLGPQEEFRACADVSISGDREAIPWNGPSLVVNPKPSPRLTTKSPHRPAPTERRTRPPSTTTTTRRTTTTTTARPLPAKCSNGGNCEWKSAPAWRGTLDNWCRTNCPSSQCDGFAGCECVCPAPVNPVNPWEPQPPVCEYKAVGAWRGQQAMNNWCTNNCVRGFCPASHCEYVC